MNSAEFGYWPSRQSIHAGHVTIMPLSSLDEVVEGMRSSKGVVDGWIYPPLKSGRSTVGGVLTEVPIPRRIFGLPKTHSIEHARATSREHLEFHVWCLSFFIGMRLTTTEAGFVDATPIKPGMLVDFILSESELGDAVELAEAFWQRNAGAAQRAKLFTAATHALFLAQRPQLLQFEEFVFCYTALDACFALAASLNPPAGNLGHAARLQWMCDEFDMNTPKWAQRTSPESALIAKIRNATTHEGLFTGQPLGFALHGVETGESLTLEMRALTCRLLVALLGKPDTAYVKTNTKTRSCWLLELG